MSPSPSLKSFGKISVALLSWNGRKHLETCLEALAEQDDPGVDWEILVLDNGSTDGTADWLRAEILPHRSRHSRVRLIASPVNLGFCGGNNRLVAEAAGDAVAFLNNDTRPQRGWLKALAAALAAAPPDVAAVSGKIIDWQGTCLDFGRGVMTFDGHAFQLDFRRPLATARVPAAGEELLFACGGNMLIRRASFLEAGGFDEDYFAYLEDVDLGWRLWSGGERITFVPDAVVHHRSSATSDLLGLYNRGFLFERNAFLTAYKNYEAGLWERIMPALLLTLVSRTQALLVEHNPGGAALLLDPYAGHIANTAPGKNAPATPPLPPPPASLPPAWTWAGFQKRWKGYGPMDFLRRGARKLFGAPAAAAPSAPSGSAPEPPRLTDERTIAQLRALSWLLGNLDHAAARRTAVQKRRKRSDREIFERFPLYVVPTYPGDHILFAGSGFQAWLPEDLPIIRKSLDEIMSLGG